MIDRQGLTDEQINLAIDRYVNTLADEGYSAPGDGIGWEEAERMARQQAVVCMGYIDKLFMPPCGRIDRGLKEKK